MPKLNIDLASVVSYLKENAGKKTSSEMSAELGYSVAFLTKIAKSQGIEISLMKIRSRYNLDQLKERIHSGMSINAAAKELGIYFNSAYYLARKSGICQITPHVERSEEVETANSNGFFNPHARENWLI